MWQIFVQFLLLGCVSFGGPAAHIGYFRNHFVERLGWVDGRDFAELLALCQFLPGPASSQLGFAIGYRRDGILGGACAFLGFTLPSVLLMLSLAAGGGWLLEQAWFDSVLHTLKLLALVVVADALWGMARSFCSGRLTLVIGLFGAIAALLAPGIAAQLAVLVLAAMIGAIMLGRVGKSVQAGASVPALESESPGRQRWALVLFGCLLALSWLAAESGLAGVAADFYQVGALVFGGGHVVLPLLQAQLGADLAPSQFLLGYAAAQAVPGPMFTLATFLGYELVSQAPVLGALLATLVVFLPGFLVLVAVLPDWQRWVARPALAGAVAGVNAVVVGLLLAALYQPVFVSAVTGGRDLALALVGLYLLRGLGLGVIALVPLAIITGLLMF
ncbi:chromate efflux transporter [Marinobacterium sedimentorum]|uniref:chromate efflux transporter n=1 Tax=Marinobacterium sedimentorum TaxID=2927804 RepID=UPI0020C6C6F9|nr:chromate efflux transporter [Marinobacterium sedimentorum]MCP8687411.1 chromate efflux transporter [Marinobacterium sedimentorum]